jgi:hypothetical protein
MLLSASYLEQCIGMTTCMDFPENARIEAALFAVNAVADRKIQWDHPSLCHLLRIAAQCLLTPPKSVVNYPLSHSYLQLVKTALDCLRSFCSKWLGAHPCEWIPWISGITQQLLNSSVQQLAAQSILCIVQTVPPPDGIAAAQLLFPTLLGGTGWIWSQNLDVQLPLLTVLGHIL